MAESLDALANGVIGTRASLEEAPPGSMPMLVAAGLQEVTFGPDADADGGGHSG